MSASAEPSEMPLPEGSQRRRKNNRACYPCQQAQRKCDRDWEIEGGSCLNCLNWGTRCIRLAPKPRTSKDRMNMANTIPYAAQAEPHLDNVSQNTGLRKGINYANRHFPGVFNEQRFVQRSWLSREIPGRMALGSFWTLPKKLMGRNPRSQL
ncbi:uncharacterized protein EI90DRAFT_1516881 [Cantharellus anzutake]|uniref:uncharacterized protein n=1 Tax=Cantharellus anzutake TaxID=1750568 RepID=UPI0019088159|nr:uncharacterized protein EI90DRAFT_1516881 [Cantharellus anzutake]KAF8328702.1 hypothetical protein EI90DRAFT_1516881 [Cantharellus anzutake]